MSQLFEFGSAVNIILRAKSEITIAGKTYKPGQIYTILEKVGVSFNYAPTTTNSSAKKPVYNGSIQSLPQSVTTQYLPIQTKLADLMLQGSSKCKIQKIETRFSDSEGKIILHQSAEEGLEVFCRADKVDNYTYNEATRTIEGLSPQEPYQIYYLTTSQNNAYRLEQNFLPYFTIELIGKGNTDKTTNVVHIVLPSVKIDFDPNFVFVDDGVISTRLTFSIIYENQDPPVMVFE